MKIEQSHINQIKIAFQNMQTKEDLLQLLNGVKPMIYGEKTIPFELKQLTWYANPKLAKNRYTQFTIKKKSGADRTINAPVAGLKAIQKVLSVVLQCVYEPHQAAMGFVKDKSIVDNASLHVGNKYVYNIDLKDFFPSVDQARVWKCLQLKPFNLISKENELTRKDEVYKISRDISPNKIENIGTDKEISRLNYEGFNFRSGFHKVKLITDGHILYKINQYVNNRGHVVIFKGKSKFNYIEETTNTGKDVDGILFRLIVAHQDRLLKKDTRLNIANIVSSICCTEMEVERKNTSGKWEKVMKNVLPQGAPTSPILTNVICQRLDYLLSAVAKRFGLKYSRYADDITFSSLHNVYQTESDFIKELHRIIAEQGFHIKESKTRLQKEGCRKEVTGLLVNDKVNVHKRYIKQLRMWLYYWENYGYERAYGFFLQQYSTDKAHTTKGKPDMVNVIGGKLDYLKMVKGAENELYLKLRKRFNKLTSRYNFIEKVINVWENEGVEKAMDLYYLKNNNSVNQVIGDIGFDEVFFNNSDEFEEIL